MDFISHKDCGYVKDKNNIERLTIAQYESGGYDDKEQKKYFNRKE